MERFNFQTIEKKWRDKLLKKKLHNTQGKKFYCLEMFPYPSGKIHMGHVRNYTIGDVIARYKYLNGFNVLHPMGWDSFGLPAENASKINNLHPKEWTKKNIATMKSQLQLLGLSIDWDLEISTCDENYYKHQQEIFIDFYNAGLVYKKNALVNWDPIDQTVLANEQVIDGKGWRTGATVEKKNLSQWFFNITSYAEELLSGLDKLELWPNKVKTMQKNWIGKSNGAEIYFDIPTLNKKIKIFTTRPDTIYGATFIALSINHPIVSESISASKIAEIKSEFEKLDEKEKQGYPLEFKCKHPFLDKMTRYYFFDCLYYFFHLMVLLTLFWIIMVRGQFLDALRTMKEILNLRKNMTWKLLKLLNVMTLSYPTLVMV